MSSSEGNIFGSTTDDDTATSVHSSAQTSEDGADGSSGIFGEDISDEPATEEDEEESSPATPDAGSEADDDSDASLDLEPENGDATSQQPAPGDQSQQNNSAAADASFVPYNDQLRRSTAPPPVLRFDLASLPPDLPSEMGQLLSMTRADLLRACWSVVPEPIKNASNVRCLLPSPPHHNSVGEEPSLVVVGELVTYVRSSATASMSCRDIPWNDLRANVAAILAGRKSAAPVASPSALLSWKPQRPHISKPQPLDWIVAFTIDNVVSPNVQTLLQPLLDAHGLLNPPAGTALSAMLQRLVSHVETTESPSSMETMWKVAMVMGTLESLITAVNATFAAPALAGDDAAVPPSLVPWLDAMRQVAMAPRLRTLRLTSEHAKTLCVPHLEQGTSQIEACAVSSVAILYVTKTDIILVRKATGDIMAKTSAPKRRVICATEQRPASVTTSSATWLLQCEEGTLVELGGNSLEVISERKKDGMSRQNVAVTSTDVVNLKSTAAAAPLFVEGTFSLTSLSDDNSNHFTTGSAVFIQFDLCKVTSCNLTFVLAATDAESPSLKVTIASSNGLGTELSITLGNAAVVGRATSASGSWVIMVPRSGTVGSAQILHNGKPMPLIGVITTQFTLGETMKLRTLVVGELRGSIELFQVSTLASQIAAPTPICTLPLHDGAAGLAQDTAREESWFRIAGDYRWQHSDDAPAHAVALSGAKPHCLGSGERASIIGNVIAISSGDEVVFYCAVSGCLIAACDASAMTTAVLCSSLCGDVLLCARDGGTLRSHSQALPLLRSKASAKSVRPTYSWYVTEVFGCLQCLVSNEPSTIVSTLTPKGFEHIQDIITRTLTLPKVSDDNAMALVCAVISTSTALIERHSTQLPADTVKYLWGVVDSVAALGDKAPSALAQCTLNLNGALLSHATDTEEQLRILLDDQNPQQKILEKHLSAERLCSAIDTALRRGLESGIQQLLLQLFDASMASTISSIRGTATTSSDVAQAAAQHRRTYDVAYSVLCASGNNVPLQITFLRRVHECLQKLSTECAKAVAERVVPELERGIVGSVVYPLLLSRRAWQGTNERTLLIPILNDIFSALAQHPFSQTGDRTPPEMTTVEVHDTLVERFDLPQENFREYINAGNCSAMEITVSVECSLSGSVKVSLAHLSDSTTTNLTQLKVAQNQPATLQLNSGGTIAISVEDSCEMQLVVTVARTFKVPVVETCWLEELRSSIAEGIIELCSMALDPDRKEDNEHDYVCRNGTLSFGLSASALRELGLNPPADGVQWETSARCVLARGLFDGSGEALSKLRWEEAVKDCGVSSATMHSDRFRKAVAAVFLHHADPGATLQQAIGAVNSYELDGFFQDDERWTSLEKRLSWLTFRCTPKALVADLRPNTPIQSSMATSPSVIFDSEGDVTFRARNSASTTTLWKYRSVGSDEESELLHNFLHDDAEDCQHLERVLFNRTKRAQQMVLSYRGLRGLLHNRELSFETLSLVQYTLYRHLAQSSHVLEEVWGCGQELEIALKSYALECIVALSSEIKKQAGPVVTDAVQYVRSPWKHGSDVCAFLALVASQWEDADFVVLNNSELLDVLGRGLSLPADYSVRVLEEAHANMPSDVLTAMLASESRPAVPYAQHNGFGSTDNNVRVQEGVGLQFEDGVYYVGANRSWSADSEDAMQPQIFYFEAQLLINTCSRGCFWVGLGTLSGVQKSQPGSGSSWVYESTGMKRGESLSAYTRSSTTGDVIGCGLILSTGAVFFTINGVFQGVAFVIPNDKKWRPTVGANVKDSGIAGISVNFGLQAPFVFDISSMFASRVPLGVTSRMMSHISVATLRLLVTGALVRSQEGPQSLEAVSPFISRCIEFTFEKTTLALRIYNASLEKHESPSTSQVVTAYVVQNFLQPLLVDLLAIIRHIFTVPSTYSELRMVKRRVVDSIIPMLLSCLSCASLNVQLAALRTSGAVLRTVSPAELSGRVIEELFASLGAIAKSHTNFPRDDAPSVEMQYVYDPVFDSTGRSHDGRYVDFVDHHTLRCKGQRDEQAVISCTPLPPTGRTTFSVVITRSNVSAGSALGNHNFVGVSTGDSLTFDTTRNNVREGTSCNFCLCDHETEQMRHCTLGRVGGSTTRDRKMFTSGDVLTFEVDRDTATVSCSVNGNSLGIVFDNLPPSPKPLYPMCFMYSSACSVELRGGLSTTPTLSSSMFTPQSVVASCAVETLQLLHATPSWCELVMAVVRKSLAPQPSSLDEYKGDWLGLAILGSTPSHCQCSLTHESATIPVDVTSVTASRCTVQAGEQVQTVAYNELRPRRIPPPIVESAFPSSTAMRREVADILLRRLELGSSRNIGAEEQTMRQTVVQAEDKERRVIVRSASQTLHSNGCLPKNMCTLSASFSRFHSENVHVLNAMTATCVESVRPQKYAFNIKLPDRDRPMKLKLFQSGCGWGRITARVAIGLATSQSISTNNKSTASMSGHIATNSGADITFQITPTGFTVTTSEGSTEKHVEVPMVASPIITSDAPITVMIVPEEGLPQRSAVPMQMVCDASTFTTCHVCNNASLDKKDIYRGNVTPVVCVCEPCFQRWACPSISFTRLQYCRETNAHLPVGLISPYPPKKVDPGMTVFVDDSPKARVVKAHSFNIVPSHDGIVTINKNAMCSFAPVGPDALCFSISNLSVPAGEPLASLETCHWAMSDGSAHDGMFSFWSTSAVPSSGRFTLSVWMPSCETSMFGVAALGPLNARNITDLPKVSNPTTTGICIVTIDADNRTVVFRDEVLNVLSEGTLGTEPQYLFHWSSQPQPVEIQPGSATCWYQGCARGSKCRIAAVDPSGDAADLVRVVNWMGPNATELDICADDCVEVHRDPTNTSLFHVMVEGNRVGTLRSPVDGATHMECVLSIPSAYTSVALMLPMRGVSDTGVVRSVSDGVACVERASGETVWVENDALRSVCRPATARLGRGTPIYSHYRGSFIRGDIRTAGPDLAVIRTDMVAAPDVTVATSSLFECVDEIVDTPPVMCLPSVFVGSSERYVARTLNVGDQNSSNQSYHGLMFDVSATVNITITNIVFKAATSSEFTTRLYTRPSTMRSFESRADAWNLVWEGSTLPSGAREVSIEELTITVAAGQTAALYLHASHNCGVAYNTCRGEVGTHIEDDGTLEVRAGVKGENSNPFAEMSTGNARAFRGSITYSIGNRATLLVAKPITQKPNLVPTRRGMSKTFRSSAAPTVHGVDEMCFDIKSARSTLISNIVLPVHPGPGPTVVALLLKAAESEDSWSVITRVEIPDNEANVVLPLAREGTVFHCKAVISGRQLVVGARGAVPQSEDMVVSTPEGESYNFPGLVNYSVKDNMKMDINPGRFFNASDSSYNGIVFEVSGAESIVIHEFHVSSHADNDSVQFTVSVHNGPVLWSNPKDGVWKPVFNERLPVRKGHTTAIAVNIPISAGCKVGIYINSSHNSAVGFYKQSHTTRSLVVGGAMFTNDALVVHCGRSSEASAMFHDLSMDPKGYQGRIVYSCQDSATQGTDTQVVRLPFLRLHTVLSALKCLTHFCAMRSTTTVATSDHDMAQWRQIQEVLLTLASDFSSLGAMSAEDREAVVIRQIARGTLKELDKVTSTVRVVKQMPLQELDAHTVLRSKNGVAAPAVVVATATTGDETKVVIGDGSALSADTVMPLRQCPECGDLWSNPICALTKQMHSVVPAARAAADGMRMESTSVSYNASPAHGSCLSPSMPALPPIPSLTNTLHVHKFDESNVELVVATGHLSVTPSSIYSHPFVVSGTEFIAVCRNVSGHLHVMLRSESCLSPYRNQGTVFLISVRVGSFEATVPMLLYYLTPPECAINTQMRLEHVMGDLAIRLSFAPLKESDLTKTRVLPSVIPHKDCTMSVPTLTVAGGGNVRLSHAATVASVQDNGSTERVIVNHPLFDETAVDIKLTGSTTVLLGLLCGGETFVSTEFSPGEGGVEESNGVTFALHEREIIIYVGTKQLVKRRLADVTDLMRGLYPYVEGTKSFTVCTTFASQRANQRASWETCPSKGELRQQQRLAHLREGAAVVGTILSPGVHTWRIKFMDVLSQGNQQAPRLHVGVCSVPQRRLDAPLDDFFGNTGLWVLQSVNDCFQSSGLLRPAPTQPNSTAVYTSSSIILVTYDTRSGEVSFTIDGVSHGVLLTTNKPNAVAPIVRCDAGCTVEIMPISQLVSPPPNTPKEEDATLLLRNYFAAAPKDINSLWQSLLTAVSAPQAPLTLLDVNTQLIEGGLDFASPVVPSNMEQVMRNILHSIHRQRILLSGSNATELVSMSSSYHVVGELAEPKRYLFDRPALSMLTILPTETWEGRPFAANHLLQWFEIPNHACILNVFADVAVSSQNCIPVFSEPYYASLASITDVAQLPRGLERTVLEMMCAVEHLHNSGLVHGAITRKSFVFGENGVIRLTPRLSQPEDWRFVAPEALKDPLRSPTENADVWSLACVVLELCLLPQPLPWSTAAATREGALKGLYDFFLRQSMSGDEEEDTTTTTTMETATSSTPAALSALSLKSEDMERILTTMLQLQPHQRASVETCIESNVFESVRKGATYLLEYAVCAAYTINQSYNGLMFDVEAKSNISIFRLGFYPDTNDSSMNVRIYYALQPMRGIESSSSQWQRVLDTTVCVRNKELCTVSGFDISIPGGTRGAVYILTSNSSGIGYVHNNPVVDRGDIHQIMETNNDMNIFIGRRTESSTPFDDIRSRAGFCGTLHYTVTASVRTTLKKEPVSQTVSAPAVSHELAPGKKVRITYSGDMYGANIEVGWEGILLEEDSDGDWKIDIGPPCNSQYWVRTSAFTLVETRQVAAQSLQETRTCVTLFSEGEGRLSTSILANTFAQDMSSVFVRSDAVQTFPLTGVTMSDAGGQFVDGTYQFKSKGVLAAKFPSIKVKSEYTKTTLKVYLTIAQASDQIFLALPARDIDPNGGDILKKLEPSEYLTMTPESKNCLLEIDLASLCATLKSAGPHTSVTLQAYPTHLILLSQGEASVRLLPLVLGSSDGVVLHTTQPGATTIVPCNIHSVVNSPVDDAIWGSPILKFSIYKYCILLRRSPSRPDYIVASIVVLGPRRTCQLHCRWELVNIDKANDAVVAKTLTIPKEARPVTLDLGMIPASTLADGGFLPSFLAGESATLGWCDAQVTLSYVGAELVCDSSWRGSCLVSKHTPQRARIVTPAVQRNALPPTMNSTVRIDLGTVHYVTLDVALPRLIHPVTLVVSSTEEKCSIQSLTAARVHLTGGTVVSGNVTQEMPVGLGMIRVDLVIDTTKRLITVSYLDNTAQVSLVEEPAYFLFVCTSDTTASFTLRSWEVLDMKKSSMALPAPAAVPVSTESLDPSPDVFHGLPPWTRTQAQTLTRLRAVTEASDNECGEQVLPAVVASSARQVVLLLLSSANQLFMSSITRNMNVLTFCSNERLNEALRSFEDNSTPKQKLEMIFWAMRLLCAAVQRVSTPSALDVRMIELSFMTLRICCTQEVVSRTSLEGYLGEIVVTLTCCVHKFTRNLRHRALSLLTQLLDMYQGPNELEPALFDRTFHVISDVYRRVFAAKSQTNSLVVRGIECVAAARAANTRVRPEAPLLAPNCELPVQYIDALLRLERSLRTKSPLPDMLSMTAIDFKCTVSVSDAGTELATGATLGVISEKGRCFSLEVLQAVDTLTIGWRVDPLTASESNEGTQCQSHYAEFSKEEYAFISGGEREATKTEPEDEALKEGDKIECIYTSSGTVVIHVNGNGPTCRYLGITGPVLLTPILAVSSSSSESAVRLNTTSTAGVNVWAISEAVHLDLFQASDMLSANRDIFELLKRKMPQQPEYPSYTIGFYCHVVALLNRVSGMSSPEDYTTEIIHKAMEHSASVPTLRALALPELVACGHVACNINRLLLHVMNLVDFSSPSLRLVQAWLSFKDLLLEPVSRTLYKTQIELVPQRPSVSTNVKVHLYASRNRRDIGTSLRYSVFGQLFHQLKNSGTTFCYHKTQIFNVELVGLGSQDYGGPCRQVLSELAREIMEKHPTASFHCNPLFFRPDPDNNSLVMPAPDMTSGEVVPMYRFFGRLLGACVLTETILAVDFPCIFWKYIETGDDRLVTFEDWCELGMEGTFRDILSGSLTDELIDEFCEGYPEALALALARGMADDRLTRAHVMQTLKLEPMAKQLRAIHEGLAEVVPAKVLCALPWREVAVAVCGRPEVTTDELRNATNDELEGDGSHMYWAVVASMTDRQRSLLLEFATGQKRLPLPSGKKMRVKSANRGDDQLPTAATCSFQLKVPSYTCEGVMRTRLLYAIEQGNTTIDLDGVANHRIMLE
eukprot:PhM_4_TR16771/c0_g1_i1/m.22748